MPTEKEGEMPTGAEAGAAAKSTEKAAPSVEQLTAELEKLQTTLRTVNGESAGRRKRLEELEAAEAKRAEEQLTAAQLADKRLTDLQAKLAAAETAAAAREQAVQRERAEYAVALKAQSLGLPVKAVLKLLDWDKLEYDAAGQPQNADKLVEAVAKEYPLLATPSGPTFGTPAGRPRTGQPPPPNTPRKIIPL